MPFFPPIPGALQNIERFVVLMFENRSFDHLLGYENGFDPAIEGVPANAENLQLPDDLNSAVVNFAQADHYGMPFDPGHEFANVALQLHAPNAGDGPITMGGFVASALETAGSFADASRVMQGFKYGQLPVLTSLAREFAVFNHWHSSLPGPTWPNRFFVHAATSGGLTESPSNAQILEGFSFKAGTIYDRLSSASPKRNWRIYHDGLPQSAGIDSLRSAYISPFTDNFSDMGNFAADALGGKLPEYTFIEPRYDTGNNYLSGNSMHPMNDIRKGEKLLKLVYDALRASPLWSSTMLIVTFDEHGGFYDHVIPPNTVPTGDDTRYLNPVDGFAFDRLGVRVPSIVASAYTQRGTIVGRAGSSPFDHTSILRTVEERFDLQSLTARDGGAESLAQALNLGAPRTDAPAVLPNSVTDAEATAAGTAPVTLAVSPAAPMSDNQQSFVDLALRCNLDMHPADRDADIAEHAAVKTQGDAARYLSKHESEISTRRALKRS
jgi:phospholipase C